jgi:2-desacetyl-2-hydroxyethyl bacteriochlorophyllide A dehydrogenase
LPPPGPDELQVRAVASAISAGTEMLVYRGQVQPELPLDLPTLRGSFAFPIKYGYASAGRVVQVGAAVSRFLPGDAVFVLHPHQDEFVVSASLATPLPAGVPIEHGVFLANLETAVNVVLDAHPRLGECVVIFGQGAVGLLLTQLLRRAGAVVVAVEGVAARRELALRFGAAAALSPGGGVPEAVRSLTDGRGADLAVEVSGNGEALAEAIDCVAFQGSVVVASWYGTKPVSVPLGGRFHRRRLRLISSQVGTVDPALQPRWDTARRMALASSLLAELELAPLISHRVPFTRAPEAYELVDRRPEQTVQVLLTYDREGGGHA